MFTDALSVPETPLKLKVGLGLPVLPTVRFNGFVVYGAVGGTALRPYDSLFWLVAPLIDRVAMPVPASVTPFVPLLAVVEDAKILVLNKALLLHCVVFNVAVPLAADSGMSSSPKLGRVIRRSAVTWAVVAQVDVCPVGAGHCEDDVYDPTGP